MNFLQPSLARRMVIAQVLAILLFSLLLMGNLLWQFTKEGDGELDVAMVTSAQALATTLRTEDSNPENIKLIVGAIERTSVQAYDLLHAQKKPDSKKRTFALRITHQNGNAIYATPGYDNLPVRSYEQQQLYSFEYQGVQWRAINYPIKDKQLMLHMMETSDDIDRELWGLIQTFILWPLLWFLPLVALSSSIVVATGLRPLNALAAMIARRSPSDLSALSHVPVYAETKPLVNEINTLLHKLDHTLTRERNFLADAAHELRTPLAVIQAQAYVLTHAQFEDDKAAACKELTIGIERAASLIQKLLLIAKVNVETFEPRLENIDLSAFVQERMAALSVLATQKNIDIELDAPAQCLVRIDRETFVSAVDNVLDNAIRYTPEGGHIQVNVTVLDAHKVLLRVTDNGAGIAPELYERVFERFYRITGTEQQGSGLGLAIVKRVLALHGGGVALSAGPNALGLSVALTLPFQAAS